MLTDAFLRKIEPPQKGQASYADIGGVPGLSIRVSQGGTKTFVLVHGRQRTRTTLGRYPIISLSQARARAKEILAEITLGTYQTQKGLTFQEALDLFKLHYLPQNRESTARETTRLCTKAALRFASLEINAITTPQIAAFLDKSTDPRGYHQHLSTFFNWCVRRGYIEQNPFSRLQKGRNTPRDRTLNPQELRSTILACSTFGRYGQLLKFLIYTGQRKGQAYTLTEKHIDRANRTLTWPASEMKTNRLHSIPYGPLTAELLENCYRSPDNRLFTKTERHHDKLVKEAGVEWFTRHDLRRSFATIHASIGTPQHVTERLLAHATPGGSAIHLVYNRFAFWDAQVEACERYEQFLSELVARG